MEIRADVDALAALLKMVGSRWPGTETELYVTRPDAMRRISPDEPGLASRAWVPLDTEVNAALSSVGCTRVDSRAFGRSDAFCVIQPLRQPRHGPGGFLLLFDPKRRRLGPALVKSLAVAAQVASQIRDHSGFCQMQANRAGEGVCEATILPRLEAQQLIEAVLAEETSRASVYLIDLDRFHALNAVLGEAAGDQLLAAVGARLETCLSPGDHVARLYGDRFVVLAPRGPQEILPFANRLLEIIRRPLRIADRTVMLEASMGIVAHPIVRAGGERVLTQAQEALRRAKREGRNRFAMHELQSDAISLENSRLELDLAEAPRRGELRLVYQPYVDLRTGALAGVEALMRWTHPRRGELAPALFIPLAEATGMILPLGSWVLRTALQAARSWPEHLTVSVNVSALQFHQPNFVGEVVDALATSGVQAARLELEITETVLMRDNPQTTAQLEALIAHGVRIALDDFGTGYSALAYLGRLPHHRIKLDRSFIHDLGNPATLELVRAILALARQTGVGVTAEGVERPDQLARVRRLGFTHAQGFLTGMPVSDPLGLLDEPATAG